MAHFTMYTPNHRQISQNAQIHVCVYTVRPNFAQNFHKNCTKPFVGDWELSRRFCMCADVCCVRACVCFVSFTLFITFKHLKIHFIWTSSLALLSLQKNAIINALQRKTAKTAISFLLVYFLFGWRNKIAMINDCTNIAHIHIEMTELYAKCNFCWYASKHMCQSALIANYSNILYFANSQQQQQWKQERK